MTGQPDTSGEASVTRLSARLRRWVWPAWRGMLADPMARLMGVGALVGVLGGLAAAVLDLSIRMVGRLSGLDAVDAPWWLLLTVPVLGGLVSGVVVRFGTRDRRPRGIADVIDATWNHGGALSLREGLATAVAAAVAIGSGQSGGREGPTVQLSSAVASAVCRRLGLPVSRARVLVAAGAAAGIAASFNAPVGAAFFAMEVILGNFAMEMFGPVVAATIAGTVMGQWLLGERVVLSLPDFRVHSPAELLAYAALGLLCGLLAVGFKRSVTRVDQLFDRLESEVGLPRVFHPALAGLAIGLLGVVGLQPVMGNGYGWMELLIRGEAGVGAPLLVLILAFKFLATTLTIGSRSGPGVFAPSLFLGAALGTLYGMGITGLFPGHAESAGAYGVVAMGAVAAAVTHSPLTMSLMLFEMTRNYQVILPILACLSVAGLVAAAFDSKSIFHRQLEARGIEVVPRREGQVMFDLAVKELMRDAEPFSIALEAPFPELVQLLLDRRVSELFVVDEDKRYHGVVYLQDIKRMLASPPADATVASVETRSLPALSARAVIAESIAVFFQHDVDELPVVDEAGLLVGVLRERDVMAAYHHEVLRKESLLARVASGPEEERQHDWVELPPGQVLEMVSLAESVKGRTLAELQLPRRFGVTVLAVVREDARGKQARLPARGDTVLVVGDKLLLVGMAEAVATLRREDCEWERTSELGLPLAGAGDQALAGEGEPKV